MGQALEGTVTTPTTEIRILEGRVHRQLFGDKSSRTEEEKYADCVPSIPAIEKKQRGKEEN
jgi:hypothetical protein